MPRVLSCGNISDATVRRVAWLRLQAHRTHQLTIRNNNA
jgi:hypothetical protein